eukprot:scaffold36480_cov51-Phaeocystis_antarctica.AAC.1
MEVRTEAEGKEWGWGDAREMLRTIYFSACTLRYAVPLSVAATCCCNLVKSRLYIIHGTER